MEQRAWNATEDVAVDRSDRLKGYEYAKDNYVVVEKEEDLRKVSIPTSRELQILETVRLSEIDPVYFETSYYLVPDRGGEKAYSMLFAAMRETGYASLGRLAMRGREHIVIIRAGTHSMVLHTMFYQDEIRSEQEFRADPTLASTKELELARMFLLQLAAPFQPQKYKDAYRERMKALIDAKIAGGDVAAAETARASPAAVDLIEALKQSLAIRKPPAISESPKAAKTRKRGQK